MLLKMMRMKKSDIVRTHTCTMIIIALFFLEIKWYEEEFRKLAAALIVKKLTLNTAKSTDFKSALLLSCLIGRLGQARVAGAYYDLFGLGIIPVGIEQH